MDRICINCTKRDIKSCRLIIINRRLSKSVDHPSDAAAVAHIKRKKFFSSACSPVPCGATENAGLENAQLVNDGPSSRTYMHARLIGYFPVCHFPVLIESCTFSPPGSVGLYLYLLYVVRAWACALFLLGVELRLIVVT